MTLPAGVTPTTRARTVPPRAGSESGSAGNALGTRVWGEEALCCATAGDFLVRDFDVAPDLDEPESFSDVVTPSVEASAAVSRGRLALSFCNSSFDRLPAFSSPDSAGGDGSGDTLFAGAATTREFCGEEIGALGFG